MICKENNKGSKTVPVQYQLTDTINWNQNAFLENTVYNKNSSWKIKSRNQGIISTSGL